MMLPAFSWWILTLLLADGFLDAIAQLPEKERAMAVKRLRIITPDQPEVVPLNLLCIPDFTWAGNAIVQIGSRIWDDYWGPRMQAALLGLFKLAHAWNQVNPTKRMGLLACGLCRLQPDLAQGGDGRIGTRRACQHYCFGCFARAGRRKWRQLGAGLDHGSCFSNSFQSDGAGTLALAVCRHAPEPLCGYGKLGPRTRLGGDALAYPAQWDAKVPD